MDIKLIDSGKAGVLPYGLSARGACFYVCLPCACRKLKLLLCRAGQPIFTAAFPEADRQGEVWRIGFAGISQLEAEQLTYYFQADGQAFSDPYGRLFQRNSAFGQGEPEVLQAYLSGAFLTGNAASFEADAACWTNRKRNSKTNSLNNNQNNSQNNTQNGRTVLQTLEPPLPFADSVLYRLHVRGFTMDKSSGLPKAQRGTFDGVRKKLPYLQGLGVTTLELLPCYEYEERIFSKAEPCFTPAIGWKEAKPTVSRVNYWGFTGNALRFAPNAAFGGAEGFRRLVEAVHGCGMELILDFYFDGTEPTDYAAEVLRHWRYVYGIDGAHLIGRFALEPLLADFYLRGMKLMATEISDEAIRQAEKRKWPLPEEAHCTRQPISAAAYHDGFACDIRRFLKGDAGMLPQVVCRMGEARPGKAHIHYMANVDGFSLMDVFSYNEKHNEANGEQNRDGSDSNFSWNCGEEGPSRRKTVRRLRLQLYRNALLMTFFSRGTPLLLAGDEMGHSRGGNNNAWCQDNQTEWLNWRDLKKNRELYDFTRNLIHFRRAHAALFGIDREHVATAASRAEHGATPAARQFGGLPPLSFHGKELWRVEESPSSRQVGMLFCGTGGEAVYLCVNMHWEPHTVSLPPLPPGLCWKRVLDTAEEGCAFPECLQREDAALDEVPELTDGGEASAKAVRTDRPSETELRARSIQLFWAAAESLYEKEAAKDGEKEAAQSCLQKVGREVAGEGSGARRTVRKEQPGKLGFEKERKQKR